MNQSQSKMKTQANKDTYIKTSIMPIYMRDKTIPVKLVSQEYPIRIVFIGGGRVVAEIVDVCMN
jgi:hypothetical protein